MRVSIPLRGPNWKWKRDLCPVSPCWYVISWLKLESLHLCHWLQMILQSHRTAACEPNTNIRTIFSTAINIFMCCIDSWDASYPQSPLVSATINFILLEWQNAPTRSCSSKGEFVSTTTYSDKHIGCKKSEELNSCISFLSLDISFNKEV